MAKLVDIGSISTYFETLEDTRKHLLADIAINRRIRFRPRDPHDRRPPHRPDPVPGRPDRLPEGEVLLLLRRCVSRQREYAHAHARRLAKRLEKYWDALLTFVEHKDVLSSNNRAEREIRPAVLMRKASYGSGGDRGAATRGVLMSIYRTLKQRGIDALAATESALRIYIASGALPPLPDIPTSES